MMMYLLDRAWKVEEKTSGTRSYLIENGQVRYVNETFHKWKRQRVAMTGTIMMNGRVMLADSLLSCQDFATFQQKQKELIKKGCTTVAVAPIVKYERQLDSIFKRAKHTMASSTLDYIIGFTLTTNLLRPSVLRRCQHHRVSFIRIVVRSFDELDQLPWTHLSQTLSTYPTVLIPVLDEHSPRTGASLLEAWTSYCTLYRIHTSPPLAENEVWQKHMLQKAGLYPEKGAMLVGSDADYLLFLADNKETIHSKIQKVARDECFVYHKKDPAVVILKGTMIKAGESISLKPGFGRCVQVKRPGRFLALDERVVM